MKYQPKYELTHFGVKGMKWGVRKAQPDNSDYNANQRSQDRREYGNGGVQRINKRMNKGSTVENARKQERKFQSRVKKSIAVAALGVRFRHQIAIGARVVGALAVMGSNVAAQNINKRAETKRGQAHFANTMGLPQKASTGPSYNEPNRKGVYNITNL